MHSDFVLDLSPFQVAVSTDSSLVEDNLKKLYGSRVSDRVEVCDYHVSVKRASGLRRYFRPQVSFYHDQLEPFKPLPENHAFAILEWGLNWVIAGNALNHVLIHSAVLAKGNKAVLFPAPPGSGKSTLTAYMASHGWRLLSDEMALIQPDSQTVLPCVRPICLKNRSIQLARQWYPEAAFSSIARNTHKGDVAHLRPPESTWESRRQPAEVVAIVFPSFKSGQETQVLSLNQTQTFMTFAANAFNYSVIGETGFNTLTRIIEKTAGFEVAYSELSELKDFLEQDVLGL